ncbi:UDP-3-O-acyl-N-acetylglucosamine deacetylase [Nitratiruptor sp. SB155-2]|uniref:UDP-3-O-acyl-N-acetylglucosamine deacetylase n=1 Tax=Nitratiruptor sp. (strain SB155-2) TaxID=387092 RepID=LPXC_NITSB|nr:UDP-3-O-acyl-N-acetylglucosamine deacetylase [Nitratiruptor sp. SB155-2]A6Q223.1 RecName: Full=UDP-3-O-acyl-N-acetylglucosamine deacetylase; Short=UDP-3-O-acyl-GlcNAc deacetylase; AltName: Full=UDP-3-O-[R-3-hydroxymyristoyl]-N-acetylglucosamine deacetylase [Nitratiruptor sp. SB155-2]BAF69532.1 UDP-3-O-[3-hydroxymyristoyl] N-acetylglucosamine deacetylase [Nitratiruptor sp. SB155-2]
MRQRTIERSVEVVGIGLHKGVPVTMRLEPLEENSGILFYRKDKNRYIELKPQNVVDTKMATVIGKDGVVISTIEHLMSAVYGYGIDNLLIILDNDEVPIMDGSAISYCMLLDEAGIMEQKSTKKVLRIKNEVEVRDGDKYVRLKPADTLSFDFTIHFDHPVIGKEHYHFEFSKKNFLEEIARARTFGFLHEVQYLRSIGLAQGGSLDNAIVLDEKKILNPDGLRFEDEFVRHKILDAIGDLSLLGMPVMGLYESFAGSHHLNHLLTVKLLEECSNYEIVEASTTTQEGYVIGAACAKE